MMAGQKTLNTAILRTFLEARRETRRPSKMGLLPLLEEETSGLAPQLDFDSALPDLDICHETSALEMHLTQGLALTDADPNSISSIGLDLRASNEIYQAHRLQTIHSLSHLRQLAKSGKITRVNPTNGLVTLEADDTGSKIYYIVSRERIALPQTLSILIDAKSTTGRLAVMCTDRPTLERHAGQSAPVIIAAQPYAIPIELEPGTDSLVQAIFRYKNTEFMTIDQVRKNENVDFLDDTGNSLNGRVQFSRYGAALTFHTDRVLVARPLPQLPGAIKLSKRGHYPVSDFFEVLEGQEEIEIAPRRFYLLGTRENIRLGNVCGLLSRETPDTGTGLWSHFAGFFWPGYAGPITMECRSESPRVVTAGDFAGFVLFDQMDAPLKEEKSYATKGTYQHQRAPQAPKMFAA